LQEDVDYWLRQFGGESALAELLAQENAGKPAKKKNRPQRPRRSRAKPSEKETGPLDNPFPPGYGEDLWNG
jgi:hypothetical protein